MRHIRPVLVSLALLLPAVAAAQVAPLNLPDASPSASVTQTVGLTEVSVHYARPAVKGREVWGKLVPYGEVWRAGANENTVVSFSSPAKAGGKTLPAGAYGLHVIPGPDEWTVILSNQAKAWGSYGYDPKEDAVRFAVKPEEAPFVERLQFTLDDPTDSTVTVALRWEKRRVAFPLELDTKTVVVASLREQLRGVPQFFWQGWNQAAAWCLKNDTNLDEAMEWADRSVRIQANFTNLRTKAALLEKKGDARGAAELREKAMAKATEAEVNQYGYQLLADEKTAEAIQVFQKNVKDHPDSWNVHDSLGEAQAISGDKKAAKASYEKALSMVQDDAQKKRIRAELDKLK
ncbi:DUF2911 domain-containing protein [Acidobacteria bacterium ACD]|nr:MAG: DUF2911 domain-containing protein [Acidobacteriota bacterium]MCE7957893.1 DUF2911 domain-containing protein [Acidobacteria bacterium ACB2]MDL1949850.1 DUF2911 domain-containing protein [Acidobacteria bacterium ACD]